MTLRAACPPGRARYLSAQRLLDPATHCGVTRLPSGPHVARPRVDECDVLRSVSGAADVRRCCRRPRRRTSGHARLREVLEAVRRPECIDAGRRRPGTSRRLPPAERWPVLTSETTVANVFAAEPSQMSLLHVRLSQTRSSTPGWRTPGATRPGDAHPAAQLRFAGGVPDSGRRGGGADELHGPRRCR